MTAVEQKQGPERGKIVWAFDIFGSEPMQARMAKMLRHWGGTENRVVQPVFVMSAYSLNLSESLYAESAERIRANTRSRMNEALSRLDLPDLAEPVLLEAPSASRRAAARALVAYAVKTGAELIAVYTRAASGPGHLLLGSFAETLVLSSPIPVLTMTPHSVVPPRIDHILFPTDLGDVSRKALEHWIAPLASRHGAKLTLLHSSAFLFEYPEATFGRPEAYEKLAQTDWERRQRALETLVRETRQKGITMTEGVLVGDQPHPAEAILSEAGKRAVSLIALVSQKEGIDVPLLGSVSREVLRKALVPTLIRHAAE